MGRQAGSCLQLARFYDASGRQASNLRHVEDHRTKTPLTAREDTQPVGEARKAPVNAAIPTRQESRLRQSLDVKTKHNLNKAPLRSPFDAQKMAGVSSDHRL